MRKPYPHTALRQAKCYHARTDPREGMFVADNGGDWRISVAPDSRIKGLEELKRLKGADFEVVVPSPPVR